MHKFVIKELCLNDIPAWLALSNEYDDYIIRLKQDLTEWYQGNSLEPAFNDYMLSKVSKHEAFGAMEAKTMNCLGVAAISRKNNRITFFGISHNTDVSTIGKALLINAMNELNINKLVSITLIQCNAEHIQKKKELFENFGFSHFGEGKENGVPVDIYVK